MNADPEIGESAPEIKKMYMRDSDSILSITCKCFTYATVQLVNIMIFIVRSIIMELE